jgi:hypothetical protein
MRITAVVGSLVDASDVAIFENVAVVRLAVEFMSTSGSFSACAEQQLRLMP